MIFLGAVRDLDGHDDSSPYKKEAPPSTVGGVELPDKMRLDFLAIVDNSLVGFEVKKYSRVGSVLI